MKKTKNKSSKSAPVVRTTTKQKRGFNKKAFISLALVFGVIGGYVIYRSFAASDPRLATSFPATSPYFQHPAPGSSFTQEGSVTVLQNSVNGGQGLLWVGPGASFTYYTNGSQNIRACFKVRDMGQALYSSAQAANVTFAITNGGGSEVLRAETTTLSAVYKDSTPSGYNNYCISTGTLPNGKQFSNLQYRVTVNTGGIRIQGVDLSGIDFSYTPPAAPPSTPKTTTPPKTTKTTPKTTTPTAPAAQADTVPPSKPDNLTATSQTGDPGIELNWSASTDNVAVAGYKLERSADEGNTWDVLEESFKDTDYFDYNTRFDTPYVFRVTAIDTAGNGSEPATTQATASSFDPNVQTDASSTIHSEDNVVSIEFPAGAIKDDAVCLVRPDTNLGQGPNISGHIEIGGPYNIICKNAQSETIDTFDQPLSVTVQTSGFKQYKKRAYYARSPQVEGWTKVAKVSYNKKDKTDNFKLTSANSFSILARTKHTPLWIKILLFLVVIGALVGLFILIARLIVRRRLQAQYEDYQHKSTGL